MKKKKEVDVARTELLDALNEAFMSQLDSEYDADEQYIIDVIKDTLDEYGYPLEDEQLIEDVTSLLQDAIDATPPGVDEPSLEGIHYIELAHHELCEHFKLN